MNGSEKENPQQNPVRSEIVLGSCLMEGDVSVAATGRRSRREAFGISLTIELLILGLLVAAPLFNSIARPQLRPMLPMQITFFHPGPRPKIGDRVATLVTNHSPKIFNPFQPMEPIHATELVERAAESNAPGAENEGAGTFIPGGDLLPGGEVTPLLMKDHTSAKQSEPMT